MTDSPCWLRFDRSTFNAAILSERSAGTHFDGDNGSLDKLMPTSRSEGWWQYITMPKITVTIEPSTCMLAANCVGMEPNLFQIGVESHVELIDANGMPRGTEYTFEATEAEIEMIEEAVDSCPTRAIAMTRV